MLLILIISMKYQLIRAHLLISKLNINCRQANNSMIVNNRQMNSNIYNLSTPIINKMNQMNLNVNKAEFTKEKSSNSSFCNNETTHVKIRSNTSYLEMDNFQLINHLNSVGKDQIGCRLLQKKIEEDNTFLNNYLYPKVTMIILTFRLFSI